MAKTTIERLREQYANAAAEATKKAQKVQEQEANLQALKQEQEAAAAAGDFDKYEDLAARISKAERFLYVMNHEKPKAEAVTEEQAREAWEDYAKAWAREMAKRWALYRSAIRELCKQYEGLICYQNEALKTRKEVAGMVAADPEAFALEGWLPNKPQPNFPGNTGDLHAPEFEFFGLHGEWLEGAPKPYQYRNFPALDTLSAIVVRHEPVEDPKF